MKWSELNLVGKSGIMLGLIALLALITSTVGFFTGFGIVPALRIVFGAVYVLFLPGFIVSFIFFPSQSKEEKSIDSIERIAISSALSIAIVPLIIFYLNLVGLKINVVNSFLTILGIILVSLLIIFIINKKRKRHFYKSHF